MLSLPLRAAARPASLARPVGATARRAIWGAAPEPAADPLWLPLDVHSPLPLFDGATPTQVRARRRRKLCLFCFLERSRA